VAIESDKEVTLGMDDTLHLPGDGEPTADGGRHPHPLRPSSVLPASGSPGVARLPRSAAPYWSTHSVLGAVGVLAVVLPLVLWLGGRGALETAAWIAVPVVAVLTLVDVLVLNPLRLANRSYTVTADAVYIARGRFVRTTLVMPTAQVLNVEIAEGPLLRAFGMVRVRFVCIGDGPVIGPVLPGEAEALRRRVMGTWEPRDAA
jgi:membrane protein YdbS with pleckstrin-like domain